MRKVLLLTFALLPFYALNQTVFLETFDEADDVVSGTDNSGGATSWIATCPGSVAATDYLKVVSGKLEARDTNSPAAEFTTDAFDISTCSGLEISFDIEESGDMENCADCGGTGSVCIDWVKLEYNLDGAGWTEISGVSCAPSMTEAPGEMIQIGEIPSGSFTYTSPCIDFGSTLQLRISCMSWAGSEYWYFDNISVSCKDCTLPIQLVSFKAEQTDNNSPQVMWTTASEFNADYFYVERSLDGNLYQPIAKINAQGYSTTPQTYSLTDSTLHSSSNQTVYYRLKQYDLNGRMTTWPTTSVYIQLPEYITAKENYIRYNLPERSSSTILNIYNISGQQVDKKSIKGKGTILWNQKGIYLIEIPELNYFEKVVFL